MPADYTPPLFDHALDQDELNRMLLWRQQRSQRASYRAQMQARMRGNPLAALSAQHRFQALVDGALDASLPPMPDDPESIPPTNQNLNS
jgi:hypothetical protein